MELPGSNPLEPVWWNRLPRTIKVYEAILQIRVMKYQIYSQRLQGSGIG
jgi:hypothetical protein